MTTEKAEPVAWRCFHCDEVFTDTAEAKDHFGYDMLAEPGCKLNAIEGGLLGIVRRQEDQLQAYHREDTASYREFYALGADHSQALRREEEKGYERGLRDGQSLAAPPRCDAQSERLKAAIEREEKYLHALIEDDDVGSVLHADIEGAFHRLLAALALTKPAQGEAQSERAAIIEECAKVAERRFAGTLTSNIGLLVAEAIRALSETKPAQGKNRRLGWTVPAQVGEEKPAQGDAK